MPGKPARPARGTPTSEAAVEALSDLGRRQRQLRSVYASARYGWPASPAVAWARRPHTFGHELPDRAAALLDGFTAGATAAEQVEGRRPEHG